MYGNEYDYNAYGAYPQYYQSYSYPTYTQPKPQGEEKKGDNEGKICTIIISGNDGSVVKHSIKQ